MYNQQINLTDSQPDLTEKAQRLELRSLKEVYPLSRNLSDLSKIPFKPLKIKAKKRVSTFCLGNEINLKKLAIFTKNDSLFSKTVLYYGECLYSSVKFNCFSEKEDLYSDILFMKYGVLVTWGLSEKQEKILIGKVMPYVLNEYRDKEYEYLHYTIQDVEDVQDFRKDVADSKDIQDVQDFRKDVPDSKDVQDYLDKIDQKIGQDIEIQKTADTENSTNNMQETTHTDSMKDSIADSMKDSIADSMKDSRNETNPPNPTNTNPTNTTPTGVSYFYDDIFYLSSNNFFTKMVISNALAQSVKLDYFENGVETLIENTRHLPSTLHKSLHTNFNILELMGKLFTIKFDINLTSNILDEPEVLWYYPNYSSLYEAMKHCLEINSRTELLNKRIDTMEDLMKLLIYHKKKGRIWLLDHEIYIKPGLLIILKEDETSNNHILFAQQFAAANPPSTIESENNSQNNPNTMDREIYGVGTINIPTKLSTPISEPSSLNNYNNNSLNNRIAWKYKHKDVEECKYDFINTTRYTCKEYRNIAELGIEESNPVIVVSAFSPIYFDSMDGSMETLLRKMKDEHQNNEHTTSNIIHQQLHSLRTNLKKKGGCAFLTVPAYLFENIVQWNLYADYVFQLNRYEYYNGIFVVEKGACNKYGFKVSSKGIMMEEVIIPPDVEEEDEDKDRGKHDF